MTNGEGVMALDRKDQHGPYCAHCGCCKRCRDQGLVIDWFCWDDPLASTRFGKHSWER